MLLSQQRTSTRTLKSPHQAAYEFFERFQHPNLEEKIKNAAQLISKASGVIFIGTGSSGIMAEYGARYFSSLGTFSMYIDDPHFPVHAKMRKNSVTIALSTSGENPFTLPLLKQIKQEKNKIVSITNNRQSTIAKMSDINISYYVAEEFYESANITTQFPVLFFSRVVGQRGFKNRMISVFSLLRWYLIRVRDFFIHSSASFRCYY